MSTKSYEEYRKWYLEYLCCCQRYEFDKLHNYVNSDFMLQKQKVGLSGFQENLQAAIKGWPELRWVPLTIVIDVEQGPRICVWFDMFYKKDGEEVHFQEIAFYKMRDGKMAEAEVMFWGPKPDGGPQQSSSSFDRK